MAAPSYFRRLKSPCRILMTRKMPSSSGAITRRIPTQPLISWMPLLAFSRERRTANMTELRVSVDAGNGGTNAVLARPNGSHKTFYEPSVRAAASGDSLGLGKEWEMDYDYVDWNGHRYVTGDDV